MKKVNLKDKVDFFDSYKLQVQSFIKDNLCAFGKPSLLLEACDYALSSGGKRYRPSLVLMIASALNKGADVRFAALSVEFFHTASLVADDLPSMDDDDERRHQPSVHKKYGEGVALLTSYALIAAGYECIIKNVCVLRDAKLSFSAESDLIGMLALENATFNTGLNGATGGQFLDIAPPDFSLETLKEIIHKKTSSLFEIAFVFGWLFGGGDLKRLEEVKAAASHFGLSFQIVDDFGDRVQDIKNGRTINLVNVFGEEVAAQIFYEEIEAYKQKIRALGLGSTELFTVVDELKIT